MTNFVYKPFFFLSLYGLQEIEWNPTKGIAQFKKRVAKEFGLPRKLNFSFYWQDGKKVRKIRYTHLNKY